MIFRTKKHLLLPLVALGLTFAMAATAHAQDRDYQRSSGPAVSIQLSFGGAPHWDRVRGTDVRELRRGEHSDYDIFRYGRNYYMYSNADDRWYMSRHYRGRFHLIDDRFVPSQFRRVPRGHWRNYPVAWEDRGYPGSNGDYATFRVSYSTAPRWSSVSGTRVEAIYGSDRPDYDVFRCGGSYYAYNNNRWYTSSRESGEFAMIDERSVPTELSRVPREDWRNYPPAWGQGGNPGHGNGNGHRNGRGSSRGRDDQRGNGHSGN